MIIRRAYGKAATLDGIPLITRGAVDYKSTPTLATGDVKLSKDGGAFANITTLPTVTPASDTAVRISLSSTELQCARLVIRFVDQTNPKEWEDQEVIIETESHPSAQYNNLGGLVVSDAGNSSSQFKSDRAETTTDYWKDAFVRFVSGSLDGQIKKVASYDGTTKIVTLTTPFTGTPGVGDAFMFITM